MVKARLIDRAARPCDFSGSGMVEGGDLISRNPER